MTASFIALHFIVQSIQIGCEEEAEYGILALNLEMWGRMTIFAAKYKE